MTETYDAIVIGAGQAGVPLSTALARAGRRTALVEGDQVGGTCVNYGCTPSKTMVASGRVAYLARRAPEYGVRTGSIGVDMAVVRQRKRDVVRSFRQSSQSRIESTPGLDLIFGEARFVGHKRLEVSLREGGQSELSADLIVINAGARPAPAPIPLNGVQPLDSTSVMELDRVPERLVVLGGSYVGLEFAQMFVRLGSQVCVVELAPRLAPREDPDVSDAVAEIMREDGIEVLLDTRARLARRVDGGIELNVQSADGDRVLSGTELLLAAGRVPNTDRLRPEAAGIETDQRGFVVVNDRLEASVPGVHAVGDITGEPAFTHISYDDYRILRANLLEGGSLSRAGRLVPYTMFIDPQLGRVGMTEQEAKQAGRRVRVARMPMAWVARALEVAEPRGFMKAVVDADTDRILGCAVLGIEGGELMSMIEIAMMGQLPYTSLRDAVFAHPLLAESLNNLFVNFDH
jgi:pyruvate/2-oxoglutarate dehydrogenase complex dihydrolipoamide dehydrogenase (E3) component